MTAVTPATGDLRDALHRQIAALSPEHRAIAERMAGIVEPIIADLAAAQARLSEVERERDEARSEASAERDRADRLRDRVEAALTDACRMDSIALMVGEMTAPERRLTKAVAKGLAAEVRNALARTEASTKSTGGPDAG